MGAATLPGSFTGIVDGFDEPDVLRGWVVATEPDQGELTITVFRDGVEIASGEPTSPRTDISKSRLKVGFRIPCARELSAIDILLGRITVHVRDQTGNSGSIRIWDRVQHSALASVISERITSMSKSDIVQTLGDIRRNKFIDRDAGDAIARIQSNIVDEGKKTLSTEISIADLSNLKVAIGTSAFDNSAIVGRDGFLFLTEGSNSILSRYSLNEEADKELSNRWIRLFHARAAKLSKRNIKYRQIIVPEKSSIMSDNFPAKISGATRCLEQIDFNSRQCQFLSEQYISVLQLYRDKQPISQD